MDPKPGSQNPVGPNGSLQSIFRQLCDQIGVTAIAKDIGWIDQRTDRIEQLASYSYAQPTKKRKLTFESGDSSEDSDDSSRKKQKITKEKGLRHFSKKVCEKVASKKETTYNEVADELVVELNDPGSSVDSKNIRRRVYDALNVLMAINIIEKQKKEITWKGLPSKDTNKEIERLKAESQTTRQRIHEKQEFLAELKSQDCLYKKLAARNSKEPLISKHNNELIYLPFFSVVTKKDSIVHCAVSPDQDQYFFDFSLPFSLVDSNQIIKQMTIRDETMTQLNFNNPVASFQQIPPYPVLYRQHPQAFVPYQLPTSLPSFAMSSEKRDWQRPGPWK